MHLDIGLQVVEPHPLFAYSLEKHLAIPIPPFLFIINVFFCFSIYRSHWWVPRMSI